MAKDLPFDEFSEKVVLGIALLDSSKCADVMLELDEDDFYFDHGKNKLVYKAMKFLYNQSNPIDVVTVTDQLRLNGDLDRVGGVEYLIELGDSVTNFSNLEFYVENLRNKRLLRDFLIEIRKINNEYETKNIEDIERFIADCEVRVNNITKKRKVGDFISMKEAASQIGTRITDSYGNESSITGVTTGFSNLDIALNGFNKGELIILAARPSVGKSALALNMAFAAARKTKQPVALFSFEMSTDMIMKRFFSFQTTISFDNIQKGYLTKEERIKINETKKDFGGVPIYIDDNGSNSIDDIILKCRKLKETQGGLSLVVIDYIGLINDPKNVFKDNEQGKIQHFSRKLKMLAGELEVPVLCLCQLNRKTEERDNKKPQLSDLRSSGAIEQDADKVLFIYRPAYYEDQGISTMGKKKAFGNQNQQSEEPKDDKPRDVNSTDSVQILIAKNRSGRVGTVDLMFMKSYGRFFMPTYQSQEQMRSISDTKRYEDLDNDD